MDRAVVHLDANDAAAAAFFIHDQVNGKIFDEEFGLVAQGLTIKRMEDRVPGAVGRGAGALGRAFSVIRGHAAERALINLALFGTRKWHTPMLQLVNGGRGVAAEIFDGILIAQPVRPLHGVVHVPAPIVRSHIAKRRRDPTLSGDRVRAGGEHFRNTGGTQTSLRTTDRCTQTGAAGAHYNHVKRVVRDRIGGAVDARSSGAVGGSMSHEFYLSSILRWTDRTDQTKLNRRIAYTQASPTTAQKNILAIRENVLACSPWT